MWSALIEWNDSKMEISANFPLFLIIKGGKEVCEKIRNIYFALLLSADTDADLTKSLQFPSGALSTGSLPSLFTAAPALVLWLGFLVSPYKQESFAKMDCFCILSMQNLMQMLMNGRIMVSVHTVSLKWLNTNTCCFFRTSWKCIFQTRIALYFHCTFFEGSTKLVCVLYFWWFSYLES